MSQQPQVPQINSKPPLFHHDESSLSDEIPTNLGVAPNDDPNVHHSSHTSTKHYESGLLDPEAFRRLSISTVSSHGVSPHPVHINLGRETWKSRLDDFWIRNEGVILVISSQAFATMMNVATRLLELEGEGMDPFQILFARMILTVMGCCGWLWWKKIGLLGAKEVRGLLLARGFSGFFGIYGMYYSLKYLPMADAVVITFLAPSVAAYACYIFLREPFSRSAQLASLVSLLGVVLIARPTSFFSTAASTTSTPTTPTYAVPTSAQRLSAIAIALVGVLGSAGAFTTIRLIGTRAHPLISVNYFGIWCTFISATYLHLTHSFALPQSVRQWAMLLFLGICGFIMQYLMTRGLAARNAGGVRATNMIYTNMLFALGLDRVVFGVTPGWWSLAGSGCILGSAVWIAMCGDGKERERDRDGDEEEMVELVEDEDEEVGRGRPSS